MVFNDVAGLKNLVIERLKHVVSIKGGRRMICLFVVFSLEFP